MDFSGSLFSPNLIAENGRTETGIDAQKYATRLRTDNSDAVAPTVPKYWSILPKHDSVNARVCSNVIYQS